MFFCHSTLQCSPMLQKESRRFADFPWHMSDNVTILHQRNCIFVNGIGFFFPLSIQCFSDYRIPHIFVNVKTSNTTYKNCNENSKSAKFRDRITLHCWKSEKYTSKPKVKQKKMKVVSLCFSYRFFPILIDMVNCYSRGELYITKWDSGEFYYRKEFSDHL